MVRKSYLPRTVAMLGTAAVITGSLLMPVAATAAPAANSERTIIPQSQMTAVWADSVETRGEGSNGPLEKVLDGNQDTYWHTQWQGATPVPPHSFVIKLGDADVADLSRVVLKPRQSSSGSGRAAQFTVSTVAGTDCTAENVSSINWTEVKSVDVPGHFGSNNRTSAEGLADVVADFTPVAARCVKITYNSTWGGVSTVNNGHEKVASLAEFNAFTGADSAAEAPAEGNNGIGTVPESSVENQVTLTNGDLTVKLDPNFPRMLSYTLGDKKILGNVQSEAPTFVINDDESITATVSPAQKETDSKATYAVALSNGSAFKAVVELEGHNSVTYKLTEFSDNAAPIKTVKVNNLDLVTLDGSDARAQISSQIISVNRDQSGDAFQLVSQSSGSRNSRMIIANTSDLAAGFSSNAMTDNTAPGARQDPNRFVHTFKSADNVKSAVINTIGWVHRGTTSNQVSNSSDARVYTGRVADVYPNGIGPDEDPFVKIAFTADANNDNVVDWQDGAIAYRSIMVMQNGFDQVKNWVVASIPFNIVSQATNPFLHTIDDIKRISLATDNLGHRSLLKGYQAEGHDSAQGDYGGHYNGRAGGFDDLVKLANGARNFNTTLGVHVNVTESYSEAYAFSEELLRMPPQKAWGWMNQAYYMNGPKDLGTGNVVDRFKKFRNDLSGAHVEDVLKWLYFDVYYPVGGWEPQRLNAEMQKQGWVVSSEWARALLDGNTWSHWSNEERYGGRKIKGINSKIQRFAENSFRDLWNPHPLLDYSAIKEFQGWGGLTNYHDFWRNIWERNLPDKFLQQSSIVKWTDNSITFENGTVVAGPSGDSADANWRRGRTFTYEGAEVLHTNGSYLLPWTDGGSLRLYHYNPEGGTSTFALPRSLQNQTSFKLYELTDQGRVELRDIPVTNGQVTLSDISADKAYVLYPGSTAPSPVSPNWGEGSHIVDPGFNANNLSAYTTTGDVSVGVNARQNYHARLNAGESSISQEFNNLPAGTYAAWAYVDIAPGNSRTVKVSVSGSGVTPGKYQKVENGAPTTTITETTAKNSTASDQWRYINQDPSFMQRVRVVFTSSGQPVTFKVAAGAGDALVRVDDIRVVPYVQAVDPHPTDQTVFFEDFEHIDTGYFPFVTGRSNSGGDARTQLAERHDPYSARGWYGVEGSRVVEGGKIIDNVLRGNWSLLSHEENGGLILRTHPGTLKFENGHRYKVSVDYQAGKDAGYALSVNYDSLRPDARDGFQENEVSRVVFNHNDATETLEHEFVAGGCGSYYLAIHKLSGGSQNDLALDDLRVEDLGEVANLPGCAALTLTAQPNPVTEGNQLTLSATLANNERAEITDVQWQITGPEGYTLTPDTAGPATVATQQSANATWTTTVPAGSRNPEFTATVTYNIGGESRTVTQNITVGVLGGIYKGVNYLSDLSFAGNPRNGWGPVERDHENGEQGSGDGPLMKLGGTTYHKGLGVHATSEIPFEIGGKCQTLKAVIGVDDTQANGSVAFSIEGDGNVIYGPTNRNGGQGGEEITVDITGVNRLVLKVGDQNGNNGNDHADWGNVRVVCADGLEPSQINLEAAPESVHPGDTVTATLTSLQPLEPVTITVPGGQDVQAVADAFGRATVTFAAPSNAGEVTLTARQTVGGKNFQDTDKITVTGSTTQPPTEPSTPTTKPTTPTTPTTPPVEPTNPDDGSNTGGSGNSGDDDSTSSMGAWDRIAGPDRVATSLKAYESIGHPNVMVLVGADAQVDALSAAPYAEILGTGVVYTMTEHLSPEVRDAISAHNVGRVVLVGGERVLSPQVVKDLDRLGVKVERVSGPDRYSTATEVAEKVLILHNTSFLPVALTTGTDFADALVAGPVASKLKGVVLLTDGDKLPPVTENWIRVRASRIVAIGGPADRALNTATSSILAPTVSFVGQDRYETSAKVASHYFATGSTMALASGEVAADAVVAGAWAAHREGGVLLTPKTVIPESVKAVINSYHVTIFGGLQRVAENLAH